MFSSEFLERYKNGEREFDNVNIQYSDISGKSFNDIIIKNSRLFFVTFRNCNFTNAKFINTEIYYATFYGGDFSNFVADNCKIDFTLFDNILPRRTNFIKCKFTWSAIFNSAAGEIDTSSCTFFKFYTNPSQITQSDIDAAMKFLGPVIDQLDISIKTQIKKDLESDAQRYSIKINESHKNNSAYNNQKNVTGGQSGYGANIQGFIDNVINAYNTANPYKARKSYTDSNTSYR
jgi:hypothetical protein